MNTLRRIGKIIKYTLVLTIIGCVVFTGHYVQAGLSMPVIERIIEVDPQTKPVDDLINDAAAYSGIDPLLIRAMVRAESGGKTNAIRFETHHLNRKDVKKLGKNESERQMYASSFGLMQVMGWHAPSYGLEWQDLLNPSTNLKVGTDILRNCLDKQKGSKLAKLKKGLQCYNGSTEYPDIILQQLGGIVAENMTL